MAAQVQNNSLYMALEQSQTQPSRFHWILWMPYQAPTARVWHAIPRNDNGAWELSHQPNARRFLNSGSLYLVYKISSIPVSRIEECVNVLNSAPVGYPSRWTQEPFTCRIWVKDALFALNKAGIIILSMDVAQIEADATQRAEYIRDSRSGLQIVNVTGASYSASV